MTYDVSIARCADYTPYMCRKALTAAIDAIGGLDWVTHGIRIGVKVNLLAAMKPETAAVTHPVLAAELCRMLTERGASVIVGDSPGGPWNGPYVSNVYSKTGMKLVEEAGARLNRNFLVCQAHFPHGRAAKLINYTAWLNDVDVVIDFCKLKTHGLTGMTAAVKNMFGIIPGTRKPEYHYRWRDAEAFSDMLIDLNEFMPPRLVLVDAVEAMEGNGPSSGTPRHMGAVVASKNPFAADLLCAALIGAQPEKIPTVKAAMGRGLCPLSPEELSIYGDWRSFIAEDFKLQPSTDSVLFGGQPVLVRRVLGAAFGARPALTGKCEGCGECVRACPADAITIKNGSAQLNRKKCIKCFCCQEFCPKGAMSSRRPAIARLLSK